MAKNVTKGDGKFIDCPHCGKRIKHQLRDVLGFSNKIEQTLGSCPHCNRIVHYQAEWILDVKAGTERIS